MTTIRQMAGSRHIETHLVKLYKNQPRLYVSFSNKESICANRLVYNPEQPDALLLTIPEHCASETGVPVITYFMDGCPHSFRADIIGCRNTGAGKAFLRISRPGIIRVVNRRSFLRLKPVQGEPIEISVTQPGNRSVCFQAQDISGGGLSVCIPKTANLFADKNDIPIRINLPGFGMVPTRVAPRSVHELAQAVRIGAQFTSISNESQLKISQYIIGRILKHSASKRPVAQDNPPDICVVGFNSQPAILDCLQPQYRVLPCSLTSNATELVRLSPDVLVFDLRSDLPASVILELKRLPNMNHVPTIVVTDNTEFKQTMDAVIIQKLVDPAILIDTIESVLVDKHITDASAAFTLDRGRGGTLLLMNLDGGLPRQTTNWLADRCYTIVNLADTKCFLHRVLDVMPSAVIISAPHGPELQSLCRMLFLNKKTKNIPIAVVTDTASEAFPGVPLPESVRLISNALPARQLARQLLQATATEAGDCIEEAQHA